MLRTHRRSSCFILPLCVTALLASPVVSQIGPPPEVGSLGVGCAGPEGTPELTAAEGQLPYLGETFTTRVDSLPTDILGNVVFMLGGSKDDWAGSPLPLDLDDLGMPGCTLYISVDFYRTVVNTSPVRYWTIFLPGDPALLGVTFYQQIFVPDARVNALGGFVSNAMESMIGAREN